MAKNWKSMSIFSLPSLKESRIAGSKVSTHVADDATVEFIVEFLVGNREVYFLVLLLASCYVT